MKVKKFPCPNYRKGKTVIPSSDTFDTILSYWEEVLVSGGRRGYI